MKFSFNKKTNATTQGTVTHQNKPQESLKNMAADILLKQNKSNYMLGLWKNGTNVWESSTAIHSDEWKVLGLHPMNGDAKPAIVMMGIEEKGAQEVFRLGFYKNGIDKPENWENIGSVRFTADAQWQAAVGNLTGKLNFNSIVWYSAELGKLGVWLDGTTQWKEIPGAFSREWSMIGCADFSGNGKESVLMLCERSNRLFAIDLAGSMKDLGAMDPEWKLCAIGDFNGNGKDDLVFLNSRLGVLAKWNDGLRSQWEKMGQIDAADWEIIGTGKYSVGKIDDLLLRRNSTGMVGYFVQGKVSLWHEIGILAKGWNIIA